MVGRSLVKSMFGGLYERDAVPVAVEDFSESAWADFEACCSMLEARVEQQRRRAADARVRPMVRANTAGGPNNKAGGRTVEEVMAFARANLRVCPQLAVWRRLYLMLPRAAAGSVPERAPLPVDRASWQHTPDVVKQECLRQQLEWAQAHGVLAQVHDFLRCMREDEWHHIDPLAWPPLAAGLPAQQLAG